MTWRELKEAIEKIQEKDMDDEIPMINGEGDYCEDFYISDIRYSGKNLYYYASSCGFGITEDVHGEPVVKKGKPYIIIE